MGENIGAAARAMLNFGLEHMCLIDPRDGWPNQSAIAMASGAARVLDDARVTGTLKEALAPFDHVYATTARSRDLSKPILTPEKAMEEAALRAHAGQRIGILFGPERAGLETEDIILANAIICVPTNPEYSSLNLAQCVLLLAYEWRRHSLAASDASASPPKDEVPLADQASVQALYDRLELALEERGFFFPDSKAASMRQNLRNLFSKHALTHSDVKIFHGIIKTLQRVLK